MLIGETVFETERLRLEPLRALHAPELYAVYSDPRLYEFIPQEPPGSLEAIAARYKFLETRHSPDGAELWFNWAIRSKDDDVCLGCVQITLRQDNRAQMAYEVGVPYWRRGYATEACACVIKALFAAGVVEICAELDTRNHASIRLLERLGFVRGELKRDADFFKGRSSDEWTYSLMIRCPLCHSSSTAEFARDSRRAYLRCAVCSLIFADPNSHPSPAEEKARYDTHRNNPNDADYRRFLSRLALPLVQRLGTRAREGLDFGSGPGPTLSIMLQEMGYEMSVYDPFYAPTPQALTRQYDFVTCTEVIEHFHHPGEDWQILKGLVRPGGWLGLMTKLFHADIDFATWYYKNDFTHTCFFSRETFTFLARRDGLEVTFEGEDVILMRFPT